MNKKYDKNNIIIASRAYFLQVVVAVAAARVVPVATVLGVATRGGAGAVQGGLVADMRGVGELSLA
jgi:hypothetical protein